MILKPAGYWFKQRGYADASFDRRLATTTGQMLSESLDSKLTSAASPTNLYTTALPAANRRHPNLSNRISEHDNRNVIQTYGEYFGQGFGKRLISPSPVYNHGWVYFNEPRPVHPDRSITQRDYRGWPPLDKPQPTIIAAANRKKPSGQWLTSCYDDFGRNTTEHIPSELIYRNDYKRIPVYPWHY